MNREHTVIFDFDGTLANTVDLMIRLYNEYSEQFGTIKVEENEFESIREMGYKKAMKLKNVRLRKWPLMVRTMMREMKEQMAEVEPYEGIVETIEKLKEQGISVGVLTSNSTAIVHEFFRVHNFPPFDFVVSEKTFFGKEKALKRIMKHRKLNREDVMYVGDEPRDIASSKKAGVRSFGVTWGLGGRTGLKKQPPDRLVDTPDELYREIILAIQ